MSSGWSKSDYLATAYVWLAERKLPPEHADSLVEVLKKAHAGGKAAGKDEEAERGKEKTRIRKMHEAASHAHWCRDDENCLGQCMVR